MADGEDEPWKGPWWAGLRGVYKGLATRSLITSTCGFHALQKTRRQDVSETMKAAFAALGLAMVLAVVEPRIEVPPIVDECDEAGHEPAGGEFLGGVAGPSHWFLSSS